MGAKRLGGKRPGGERLGGETTRGGNGLGAKRQISNSITAARPWYNRDLKRMVRRKSRLYSHEVKPVGLFQGFPEDMQEGIQEGQNQPHQRFHTEGTY